VIQLARNVGIEQNPLRVRCPIHGGDQGHLHELFIRGDFPPWLGIERRFVIRRRGFELAPLQLGIVYTACYVHKLVAIDREKFVVAQYSIAGAVIVGSKLHSCLYTIGMFSTTARALLLSAAPILAAAANFNGTWDATIVPANDPVAFKMEITESPAKVCFFEDMQPVCSTSAKLVEGKLTAQWDFYKSELRLEPSGKGLAGVYHSFRSNRDMKVEAVMHTKPPAPRQAPAKLDGEWEMRIDGNPKAATYQLLLRQSGADIKGTVLRVDGDEGTMVGRVDGGHFVISHFSGDRPTTLTGDLKPDGSLELTRGAMKAVALRPAEARALHLPPPLDPGTHARAKNPEEPFHFRFPDLNGRVYTEANFRGKPYIVTITGSWCPNCRDEAPFLA